MGEVIHFPNGSLLYLSNEDPQKAEFTSAGDPDLFEVLNKELVDWDAYEYWKEVWSDS